MGGKIKKLIALTLILLQSGISSASVTTSINGTSFTLPNTGEVDWGDQVTNWMLAVSAYTLQPTGGDFPLSSDLDFGEDYGIYALHVTSKTALPASSGVLRLANTDCISWRNTNNTIDECLTTGSSAGLLSYAGRDLVDVSSPQTLENKTIDISGNMAGTANQVILTTVGSTTTFSTPQDIATTSDTQFNTVKAQELIVKSPTTINTIGIKASQSLASNYQLTLPLNDGGSSQFLQTDGAGILTWATQTNAPYHDQEVSNIGLSATVGANALTIAMKGQDGNDCSGTNICRISFRSSTPTTGVFNTRTVEAAFSITVPSGATLGHVANISEYIYVYALDNAGTVLFALSSSGNLADEGSVADATLISTGADSRSVIYSSATIFDVPIRLIGRITSSQSTAGTWAAAVLETVTVPFTSDRVTSKALGVSRFEWANVLVSGGTPSVDTSSSNWVQDITDTAQGKYTLNFATGAWGSIPYCVCVTTLAAAQNCSIQTAFPTTTNATVGTWNTVTGAQQYEDTNFTILCVGGQ